MSHYKKIREIDEEKKRLKHECRSLEKEMEKDWTHFKKSLRPSNIAEQMVVNFIEHRNENENAKEIIKKGLSEIAGNLVVAAGKKIEKWLKP